MTRTDLQRLAEAYKAVSDKQVINEGILDRINARVAGVKSRIKDVGNIFKDKATAGGTYASGKTEYIQKNYEGKFNGLLDEFETDLLKLGVDQSHVTQIVNKITADVKSAFTTITADTIVVPDQAPIVSKLSLSGRIKKDVLAKSLVDSNLVLLDKQPKTLPDQAILVAELLKSLQAKGLTTYPDAKLITALSDTKLFIVRKP